MARVYAEGVLAPQVHQRSGMTESLFYEGDIISIKDLNAAQIQQVLEVSARLKAQPQHALLSDKIIAHCFFEPSTRTRLSFETATLKLNGKVIGFSSQDSTSTKKGETLHDTIHMMANYADLIIIRHAKEGAARLAADVCAKPVINAGDGANQHPTQSLVDLFTILETQQRLHGLNIAIVGDLLYGRAAHSLLEACMFFDIRLFLVAADDFTLPDYMSDTLKKKGVKFSFHQSIEEVIPKTDILFMTRLQQERLTTDKRMAYEKRFILTPAMLANAKPNLKILHALPRVNEIDIAVDKTPYAYYFQQAANGVFVRQALLALLLNKVLSW